MKEIKIIDEIKRRAGHPGNGVVAGIGDDCAVLDVGSGEYLLWATDMLVEGTHFEIGTASYKDVGHKAVAVNVSDIAAMGGIPVYITVTLGLPRYCRERQVTELYSGIFGICDKYGIKVIGGDTNRSDRMVIDVSILGKVEKNRMVRRSGATKGDMVLITGPVRDGKKEHLGVIPRLDESREVTGDYKISSMIDVSDGISMDILRVCSASGVGCRLYSDAIPLSTGLVLNDALYYGESFELLFTMSAVEAKRLFTQKGQGKIRGDYYIIGEVVSRGEGCIIAGKEGKKRTLKMKGYRHLGK